MVDYGNFSTPLSTCRCTGMWKGCCIAYLSGCPQFSHFWSGGIDNRLDDLQWPVQLYGRLWVEWQPSQQSLQFNCSKRWYATHLPVHIYMVSAQGGQYITVHTFLWWVKWWRVQFVFLKNQKLLLCHSLDEFSRKMKFPLKVQAKVGTC